MISAPLQLSFASECQVCLFFFVVVVVGFFFQSSGLIRILQLFKSRRAFKLQSTGVTTRGVGLASALQTRQEVQ